jgi:hypothetical protein
MYADVEVDSAREKSLLDTLTIYFQQLRLQVTFLYKLDIKFFFKLLSLHRFVHH